MRTALNDVEIDEHDRTNLLLCAVGPGQALSAGVASSVVGAVRRTDDE